MNQSDYRYHVVVDDSSTEWDWASALQTTTTGFPSFTVQWGPQPAPAVTGTLDVSYELLRVAERVDAPPAPPDGRRAIYLAD